MKEKIKKLFTKKTQQEEPIFENDKEELKYLREENERLKEQFCTQAIEKLKTRRSIRKYSSEKQIDFKIIHSIIEAGTNAPCAGNIQNYKIIILDNKEKMTEIAKAALQQYWMSDAPCYIIVIRQEEEMRNLYPDYGVTYAIQNTAATIENIVNAAHLYDLGACWVECGDNDVIKEILKVPKEHFVDAIIPIGYPTENPKVPKVPTAGLVYFNKWGEKKR